jgi:hypothetical protein
MNVGLTRSVKPTNMRINHPSNKAAPAHRGGLMFLLSTGAYHLRLLP